MNLQVEYHLRFCTDIAKKQRSRVENEFTLDSSHVAQMFLKAIMSAVKDLIIFTLLQKINKNYIFSS